MSAIKELGKLFCEAREKKGMTIAEASTGSRIHFKVIKDIETGVLDRLGKPYLKSFMKKYAEFLDMNTEDMLKQYEPAAAQVPVREFSFDIQEKENEDKEFFPVTEKNIQKTLAVIISGVLVVLVFVFMGMIRGRHQASDISLQTPDIRHQTSDFRQEVIDTKPQVEMKRKPSAIKKSASKDDKKLTLTLRAREDAWVHITEGENILYSGIIEKGVSETWTTTDSIITVWTGKAEMLDFVVNDHDLGKVTSGVVKNIKVSPEGVKIGKTWAFRI